VLRWPKATLLIAVLVLATTAWPLARLGGEFMPAGRGRPALHALGPAGPVGARSELLQQTDRMIKTVPEVESVFGKAGRAETATDPAPLEMFETTIQLKPRDQWRPA
jgi:Cu(I)/Ag(I) efflux system membrane protein CusA/SilA